MATFYDLAQTEDDGALIWSARDLMKPLGYVRWKTFEGVLQRVASSQLSTNHVKQVTKPITVGRNLATTRHVVDFHLSLEGCVAVALECDRSKFHVPLTRWLRAGGVGEAPPLEEPTFPQATGFVYFIQGKKTRRVKIGFSVNPTERLRDLQCGSPDKLVLLGCVHGTVKTERELHKKFAHLHSHGEWFECDTELAQFIAQSKMTSEEEGKTRE